MLGKVWGRGEAYIIDSYITDDIHHKTREYAVSAWVKYFEWLAINKNIIHNEYVLIWKLDICLID